MSVPTDQYQSRLQSFFSFFASVHSVDNAYSEGKKEERDSHKKNSRKLFKQSTHFIDKIPLISSAKILDVGMGSGFHCQYFAKKRFRE